MNESFNLKTAQFPKVMAHLRHSNQFLKFFSLATLSLAFLTLIVLLVTVQEPPIVLTLSPTGEILKPTEDVKPEDQVRSAITNYLLLRYRWTPKDVKQNLNSAKAFILPKNTKSFESATNNVAKFALEKAVSQKIYPEPLAISIPNKTVTITGDRVTSIQGLKAATDLKLELMFESGERKPENPWGIYITKEREE